MARDKDTENQAQSGHGAGRVAAAPTIENLIPLMAAHTATGKTREKAFEAACEDWKYAHRAIVTHFPQAAAA